MRSGWHAGWLLGAALLAGACSSTSKGALILAISTDMQAPKDIDVISVFVATDGIPKFDYIGRVLPDGTVSLPSTLAVVQPDDPQAQVRIRVTAFKTQEGGDADARVLRDILTTVPDQTVLLRIPISFLDDGSVTGTLPATLVPDPANGVPEGDTNYDPTSTDPGDPGFLQTSCDSLAGQTSVAGSCVSSQLASAKLSSYSSDDVFGPGGTPGDPVCFDPTRCLKVAQQMTDMVDMATCSFPIPTGENGQDWNCALATTDGVGLCSGSECYVPLDNDPSFGFTVEPGVAVHMVPGVCEKLMVGAALWVDKTSCATKVPSMPVCQPGSGGGDAGFPADASSDEGGGG